MDPRVSAHTDLCAAAGAWLAKRIRCSPVLVEASHYIEQPDAIGWQGGRSHLVECKVSRADFLRDRRKLARKHLGMGASRWYFVPWGLVSVDEVPPGWGLVYVRDGRCRVQRKAKSRPYRDALWEVELLTSALTLIQRAQDGIPIHRNARAEALTRNIASVAWFKPVGLPRTMHAERSA